MLHVNLHIPVSVYDMIYRQYQEKPDREESLIDWYLSHHPAPSWGHVATSLYNMWEHEVLQAVRNQVPQLKGMI